MSLYNRIRPTTNGSCGDNWFADLRSFSGSVRPIDKAAVDFDRADSEGYQRLMD